MRSCFLNHLNYSHSLITNVIKIKSIDFIDTFFNPILKFLIIITDFPIFYRIIIDFYNNAIVSFSIFILKAGTVI